MVPAADRPVSGVELKWPSRWRVWGPPWPGPGEALAEGGAAPPL